MTRALRFCPGYVVTVNNGPRAWSLGGRIHGLSKRPIRFCLCVDDFAIKYYSENDAKHLLHSLEKNCTVTTDWSGQNFCGLTIDWHYDKGFVDIAMPKYVARMALFQPAP